jgi:formyl-CoA transferase
VGGQQVEVAAHEVIAATMIYDTVALQYLGLERKRSGRWLLAGAPMLSIAPARDGWCGVQAPLSWQLRGLLEWMGQADLLQDERFRTPEARAQHSLDLDALITAWTSQQDAVAFYHAAQARRLPFHFVPTAQQVFESPHLRARGFWDTLPLDDRALPVPGLPFRLSGELDAGRALPPAPALGAHTAQVLAEAGLSDAAIAAVTGPGDEDARA